MALREQTYALLEAAGQADSPQAEPLCQAWEQWLRQRLKAGVEPEQDCPEAFGLALGYLVLDSLTLVEESGTPASFTAGSFSVQSGGASARQGRAQALELLRPWMQDGGFAFCGVRG